MLTRAVAPGGGDARFAFATVLAGLAHGAAWTALPWLASRLFGLRHFGANFGAILTLSGPVVLALTFGVAPAFYDAHAGERAAPSRHSTFKLGARPSKHHALPPLGRSYLTLRSSAFFAPPANPPKLG